MGPAIGEWLLYGREPNGVEGGTGKAEAAKLQDAGISPKQWLKKMSGRKRDDLSESLEIGWLVRAEKRPSERRLRRSKSPPKGALL